MKRTFFNILSASLTLAAMLCHQQVSAQDSTLRVSMTESVDLLADGTTASLLTVYQIDETEYSAFNFELVLPNEVMVGEVALTDRADGHAIAVGSLVPQGEEYNVMRVACIGTTGRPFKANSDGAICTISITAPESMETGTYTATLANCKFVHTDPVNSTAIKDVVCTTQLNVYRPMSIDIAVGAAGWATMMLPYAAAKPEGMTVYVCTGVDESDYVVMEESKTIEAYIPYLINSAAGTYTFDGPACVKDVTKIYTEGILTGVLTETKPEVGKHLLQTQGERTAFFRYTEENKLMLPAYHCYLSVPSESKVIRLRDSVTAIGVVPGGDDSVDVYDVQGMMVRSQVKVNSALDGLPAGIYVVNGIKFVKQ